MAFEVGSSKQIMQAYSISATQMNGLFCPGTAIVAYQI